MDEGKHGSGVATFANIDTRSEVDVRQKAKRTRKGHEGSGDGKYEHTIQKNDKKVKTRGGDFLPRQTPEHQKRDYLTPTKRSKTHNRKDGCPITKHAHDRPTIHETVEAVQLFQSYSPELQDLFRGDYDFKAPFGENIKVLNKGSRNNAAIPTSTISLSSSAGSPCRKRRKVQTKPRTTDSREATALDQPMKDSLQQTHGPDKTSTITQPTSRIPSVAGKINLHVSSANEQPLPIRPRSTPSCNESTAYEHQRAAHTMNESMSGTSRLGVTKSSLAKDAGSAFDPSKAPKALIGLEGSSADAGQKNLCSKRKHGGSGSFQDDIQDGLHGRRVAHSSGLHTKASVSHFTKNNPHGARARLQPLQRWTTDQPPHLCICKNLARYFTSAPNRIPTLKTWPGHKKTFFSQIRMIATCQAHPTHVRKACRDILELPNNDEMEDENTECWTGVDLVKGLYSDLAGRYKVNPGRAQSSIAPSQFYKESSSSSLRRETPIGSLELDSDLASDIPVSSNGSPGKVNDKINQQPNSSRAKRIVDRVRRSPANTSDNLAENAGGEDKMVEDVIDWATKCLIQDPASSISPQSSQSDGGSIEEVHLTPINPKKETQPLPQQSPNHFSRKAKRHQSLPARLATPAPVALQPAQTPGERIQAFAKEHLAKVPNLSLVDIKRVVEELDRRLTEVEADKEASRSMRSSDGPGNVTPATIIHYSPGRGFRNENSASTSGASANASSSTSVATPASGFRPINQPVSNARELTNAMPPPPLPHKPKSKSIAQQKLEKPELSADVPVDQRLPEADIIDLGRRKLAYTRHESAPYAFNYRGKLRKEYKHLLTKVGVDEKTVRIAEEVSRLS